jgi:two-component system response regulator FlrC
MPRILLIGTLAGDLAALALQATREGAVVSQAETIAAGMDVLRRVADAALVIADVGYDLAALKIALNAERFVLPVIVAGRDMQPAQAASAIAAGARDVLPLPAAPGVIRALLGAVPRDAAAPGSEGAGPIVRDPIMLALLRRAEQIAFSDASVLITGESGTGKEVIARLIHAKSRRAHGPFVAINCAAIPDALLESEMFGHEKGAFSGAIARRLGKFEAATGGTLLLDEISEMNVRLQSKLLRAIQEREIDRVGGTAPVRVNVRILATSNRDLPADAKAGRFREDLYFRLNVVGLRIPPLRERPADIPALAEHFVRYYAKLNGLPARGLSIAAQSRLRSCVWRGNVRELENTMHRAVLLATGDEITAEDIETGEGAAPASAVTEAGDFIGRPMADVERDHILHTLSHTLGNRTHAATMLGISIRALRNKLKDYSQSGISVPPPQAGVAA